MRDLDLSKGWSILQDVHDLGEVLAIFRPDWSPHAIGPAFSEWEPIERLAHLQLLLAEQPYFGRELRHFNEHPWWYRLEFQTPVEEVGSPATLCFGGVDYFCKVWLNGEYLGFHEGYFAPFAFEVGHLLQADAPNVLVVKVWSPWDRDVLPGLAGSRRWAVVRDLVKGTYEHADTFIQRDVNPVGLWGQVNLSFHSGVQLAGRPAIDVELCEDRQAARVQVACPLQCAAGRRQVALRCRIYEEDTGRVVATAEQQVALRAGLTQVELALSLPEPRLWHTWDRGEPALYRAVLEVASSEGVLEQAEQRFGVRTVELRRTPEETTIYLNGARFYVRGTSYFPDVYVSAMHRARYERDLAAIRQAGCNAVRVHVHVEQPDFYDLCDELGLAVIQDSDLNWVHPTDEAWQRRAVQVFGDMIGLLRNHPSIVAWVCFNEPGGDADGDLMRVSPGPQLYAEAQRLDPGRPAILGCGVPGDAHSGDSHNYTGSLRGADGHYTDIYGTVEKLNTEFGFDAPPGAENLRLVSRLYRRLAPIIDDIGALQHYQYRLLKYYVEHYRIQKHRPCSGYVQFMFIDLCPQSFYGVLDWWGLPKEGLKALQESNQPLAIVMEHHDLPVALWAINDLGCSFLGCSVQWSAVDGQGKLVAGGEATVDLPADSAVRVTDLALPGAPQRVCRVNLSLRDAEGRLLARNVYRDPFHHPPHPKGHPHRMGHELGMRLYRA